MKKILYTMTVLLAGLFAASCQKEGEPLASDVASDVTEFDTFAVSGNAEQTIQVTANGDWIAGAPEWVTLSKYSGSGNGTLTVQVQDNMTDGVADKPRDGFITIGGGSASIKIPVLQYGDKGKLLVILPTVTIPEFLDLPESKDAWYHLRGKITNIRNDQYGNFDMEDAAGNTVYVYGLTATKKASNDKSFPSLGLGVGSEVSIAGYRTSYGGEIEVGGAYPYDPDNQNIQVSPESMSLEKEAGTFKLDILSRGTYTASAPSWITLSEPDKSDIYKDVITVTVAANETYVPRTGEIAVKVNVDGNEQTVSVTVSQKAVVPEQSTVAEIKAAQLGSSVHVQGTVMMCSTSTGYIVDDGTGPVLVYAKASWNHGDKVQVVGKTSVYNYGFQIGTVYDSRKLGKDENYAEGTPTILTDVSLQAIIDGTSGKTGNKDAAVTCQLVKVTGTVNTSGNFASLDKVCGLTGVSGSLFTPKGMDLKALYGGDDVTNKDVVLTGYLTAYNSSKKQVVLYVTKQEPVAVPE